MTGIVRSMRGLNLLRPQLLKPTLVFAFLLTMTRLCLHYYHTTSAGSTTTGTDDRQHRSLIFGNPLPAFVEQFVPFFRPNQYILQDIPSFVIYFVCTDIRRAGCDSSNTIQFVNTPGQPKPNGFRYHDRGPYQLQGVFWTQQDNFNDDVDPLRLISRTDLVSFAKTRHGQGVQTGVLQTDGNGYEYVSRPLGDHTWAINPEAPDTYLSALDVLYLYDLTQGTLENPLQFEIIPSFKVWFDCLRFNFGNLISFAAKFEQILITDPNSPHQLKYPGSVVWLRRSSYLNGLVADEYLIVQVVDGNGQTIEPAWSEFQSLVHVTSFPGLLADRLEDRQTCS